MAHFTIIVVTKCESAAGFVGITYICSASMHSDNINALLGDHKDREIASPG
jgi:hypothetical protein